MFWLVLAMLLTIALAGFVLAIVALPARRAGRSVLTARGERLLRVDDREARAPKASGGRDRSKAQGLGERAKARGRRSSR